MACDGCRTLHSSSEASRSQEKGGCQVTVEARKPILPPQHSGLIEQAAAWERKELHSEPPQVPGDLCQATMMKSLYKNTRVHVYMLSMYICSHL